MELMDLKLEGKKALVTGGTRGIGKAIAERLAHYGAQVTITGRTATQNLPEGIKDCLAVDLEDKKSLEAFLAKINTLEFDIVINNAGFNKNAPFESIDPDTFEKIQQVNLSAPFRIIQNVLPSMRTKKWGRIINIASIWSRISKSGRASYSASKFALDGLTIALAAEVASEGILANCVSPGFIDTDLTRTMLTEAEITDLTSQVPIKRLGTSDEIAQLVCFLSSEVNTFICGQNIVIDGGFTRV